MKPLFLTYTNEREPYLTLANKLGKDVRDLEAGDFFHLKVKGPGNNMNFYAEVNGLLYAYISDAINSQPVVFIDSDHRLVKPIDHLFEKEDWDIAVVFRFAQIFDWGRQDYCAGMIALNNKRPNVIKNFWIEWTYRTTASKKHDSLRFPKALKDDGWLESWFTDQAALNEVLLPAGNQQEPEKDDYKIIPGEIYQTHDYKVLPLDRRIYGAVPQDSKDACIIHYKGSAKNQRLR